MLKRIFESFSDKKFRYGAFSTLTALFVIAILLVVNLVAGQLNFSFDMTKDKQYSLSQDSIGIIQGLTQDVTIYALFKTGEENALYNDLLKEYPAKSSKIKLEYKDPTLYPKFVQQYAEQGQQVPVGSVVVESGDRHRLLLANDIVVMDYDQQTWQQYVKSVEAEPLITNAIVYVSSTDAPVIYNITGHNETPLDAALSRQLQNAGYEVKDFDISTADKVPDDAKIILITMPGRDWTADEANKAATYLQNDGNAFIALDAVGGDMPNLDGVLNAYGISRDKDVVIDPNPSNYYNQDPSYFRPSYTSHQVNEKLVSGKYNMLLLQPCSISTMDVKKNSLTVEPLLQSSTGAYGKIGQYTTLTKEAGDLPGPLSVSVAVTDSYYTDKQHTAKLVVVGSTSILNAQADAAVSGGNSAFLVSAMSWMRGQESSQYIAPKTSSNLKLQMTSQDALVIILVTLVIIPLAIIVLGVVVYLRRRNS